VRQVEAYEGQPATERETEADDYAARLKECIRPLLQRLQDGQTENRQKAKTVIVEVIKMCGWDAVQRELRELSPAATKIVGPIVETAKTEALPPPPPPPPQPSTKNALQSVNLTATLHGPRTPPLFDPPFTSQIPSLLASSSSSSSVRSTSPRVSSAVFPPTPSHVTPSSLSTASHIHDALPSLDEFEAPWKPEEFLAHAFSIFRTSSLPVSLPTQPLFFPALPLPTSASVDPVRALKFHKKLGVFALSADGDTLNPVFPQLVPILLDHCQTVIHDLTPIPTATQPDPTPAVGESEIRLVRYAVNSLMVAFNTYQRGVLIPFEATREAFRLFMHALLDPQLSTLGGTTAQTLLQLFNRAMLHILEHADRTHAYRALIALILENCPPDPALPWKGGVMGDRTTQLVAKCLTKLLRVLSRETDSEIRVNELVPDVFRFFQLCHQVVPPASLLSASKTKLSATISHIQMLKTLLFRLIECSVDGGAALLRVVRTCTDEPRDALSLIRPMIRIALGDDALRTADDLIRSECGWGDALAAVQQTELDGSAQRSVTETQDVAALTRSFSTADLLTFGAAQPVDPAAAAPPPPEATAPAIPASTPPTTADLQEKLLALSKLSQQVSRARSESRDGRGAYVLPPPPQSHFTRTGSTAAADGAALAPSAGTSTVHAALSLPSPSSSTDTAPSPAPLFLDLSPDAQQKKHPPTPTEAATLHAIAEKCKDRLLVGEATGQLYALLKEQPLLSWGDAFGGGTHGDMLRQLLKRRLTARYQEELRAGTLIAGAIQQPSSLPTPQLPEQAPAEPEASQHTLPPPCEAQPSEEEREELSTHEGAAAAAESTEPQAAMSSHLSQIEALRQRILAAQSKMLVPDDSV
jgi:hypothetical protein